MANSNGNRPGPLDRGEDAVRADAGDLQILHPLVGAGSAPCRVWHDELVDDVEIVHRRRGELACDEEAALSQLVETVAEEFVPPLHERSGTTEQVLTGGSASGPTEYVAEMLLQDNLLVLESGVLVGFMSFRPHHHVDQLPYIDECIYVSTLAVRPDRRRHGYAQRLYMSVFALPDDLPSWVVLRTWSTNDAHMPLLSALGFTLLSTLDDHRGPGVHTLYFGRQRELPVAADPPTDQ